MDSDLLLGKDGAIQVFKPLSGGKLFYQAPSAICNLEGSRIA
jgi:predicted aldo/keto reductase-like oxidoreductase